MLGRYLEQRINIYGRMLGPEIYTNQRRSQELRKGGTMLLAGDSMHSGPLWGLETCPPGSSRGRACMRSDAKLSAGLKRSWLRGRTRAPCAPPWIR